MDYLYEESTVFIILFFVAFFASLIDSIAGGGGLLTTPSMLLLGISPLNVLATYKFQSCFGTFTSTYNYYKNGLLTEKKRVLYFVLSFPKKRANYKKGIQSKDFIIVRSSLAYKEWNRISIFSSCVPISYFC